MRVVHLEGVRRRAVGERRLRGGEALRRAEHGRTAAEPERRQPAAEDDARLLGRAAERHAEMVAQQIERAREDVGRQRPVADRDHLAAELLGEGHEDGSRAALTCRCQAAKRSSRSAAPRRGSNSRSRRQHARRSSVPAHTPVASPAR